MSRQLYLKRISWRRVLLANRLAILATAQDETQLPALLVCVVARVAVQHTPLRHKTDFRI